MSSSAATPARTFPSTSFGPATPSARWPCWSRPTAWPRCGRAATSTRCGSTAPPSSRCWRRRPTSRSTWSCRPPTAACTTSSAPTPPSPVCRWTRWPPCWPSWSRKPWSRARWSSARAIRRGRCTWSRRGGCACSWRRTASVATSRYLRRGDFFGELSLFKREARSTTVEAVAPCRLLRLTEGTFTRLLTAYPEFRTQLEERIAQYDYRTVARVPLDFAEETLPAELRVKEKVGPRQVEATRDEDEAEDERDLGRALRDGGGALRQARQAHPALPARAPDRRDGLRRRGAGHGLPALRARGQPGPHPPALLHLEPDGTSLRALCRAATELGLAARRGQGLRPRTCRSCRSRPSCTGRATTGSCSTTSTESHVRIADPALGLRRLPRADFERRWSGYAALFDYTDAFAAGAGGGSPALAWLWPFVRPFKSAHRAGDRAGGRGQRSGRCSCRSSPR